MNFAQFSITLLLFVTILCDASTSNVGKHKRIDVKKSLISSKTMPHKSIKNPDGDISDCIDIYQQPAIHHPSLKNHTILMTPTYYQEGSSHDQTKPVTQLWRTRERCPDGTIPIIRRTTNYGIKKPPTPKFSQFSDPGYHCHKHAVAYVKGKNCYGGKARINVWQPQVQNPSEFSLAQIWVLGGPNAEVNTIEAGWHVNPGLNGDNRTRLFTFWTADGYHNSGCYNLQCPGFVQISQEVALGALFSPVSCYQGSQYEITIAIWKDATQNEWWLFYENIALGYWPDVLFTHLKDIASGIEWGGEVVDTRSDAGQHTTTQMGSSHFAEEGFRGASYFANLQVIDESGNSSPPDDEIETIVTEPNCYNIKVNKDNVGEYYFFYGGPGRNHNCS